MNARGVRTRACIREVFTEDPDVTARAAAEACGIDASTAGKYLRELRGYRYPVYSKKPVCEDDGFWEQVEAHTRARLEDKL